MAAKSPLAKAAMFLKLKPAQLLAPVIGIMKASPIRTSACSWPDRRNLAHRFGITRAQMDEFAARSHARVIRAQRAATSTTRTTVSRRDLAGL